MHSKVTLSADFTITVYLINSLTLYYGGLDSLITSLLQYFYFVQTIIGLSKIWIYTIQNQIEKQNCYQREKTNTPSLPALPD